MKYNTTPGPWEIEEETAEEYWVGRTHYNVGPAIGIESIHDAHLIANALDVRDNLVLALGLLEDIPGSIDPEKGYASDLEWYINMAINRIRKTLAKLGGEA